MPDEIIDCEEFSEVPIRSSALIRNGELNLDPRIHGKGYLNVALRGGEFVFRADRYVGLIPVTPGLAIRVRPRASISNLSHMVARSAVAPIAIPAYSRGYLPRFEAAADLEHVYTKSLIAGVERVATRGLLKTYVVDESPPPWRGRLLASETVRKHFSRGVRYRHEFEHRTLSVAGVENIALREAMLLLRAGLGRGRRSRADMDAINRLLPSFVRVPDWAGRLSSLVAMLGHRIPRLPLQLGYYRDPLWMAFLVLQSSLPDIGGDGSVSLDSLIVDVSKVFEAFVRRTLVDRSSARGWVVRDGNMSPSSFFTDVGDYQVKPDIVISEGNRPIAVLDAKYKLDPKEGDRYELLSFMDALGVRAGGFILPTRDGGRSRFLGTTHGGKRMSNLRFDLGAANPEAEADRLFTNVQRLVTNNHFYL